jgi:hypothetical protein
MATSKSNLTQQLLFEFFLICFALALPGMLLLPKIAPWNVPAGIDDKKHAGDSTG